MRPTHGGRMSRLLVRLLAAASILPTLPVSWPLSLHLGEPSAAIARPLKRSGTQTPSEQHGPGRLLAAPFASCLLILPPHPASSSCLLILPPHPASPICLPNLPLPQVSRRDCAQDGADDYNSSRERAKLPRDLPSHYR
ncbi:hypothetical protein BDY17DRAFT_179729 [Neohortaea acidophila]|uniref:Uncharacterized protein n=1 Tax=Neohortaea acidophila TaxID=245834 RepID=A0A6A6PMB7_9PEZI|nr:uncharacterized protein BDY17DRAFT_179729 [Neohortaea acidophila]KAF2480956.1 hypothetical protein BDY17DRAFT_179729 [Neohortaea acidophila]